MSRRRRSSLRAVVWFVLAAALITVLGAAEALLRHSAGLVLTLLALPAGGFVLGRWQGRQGARPRRAIEPVSAELARLRVLVADLESAAGRPIEAILATYRHIQRRYTDGDQ